MPFEEMLACYHAALTVRRANGIPIFVGEAIDIERYTRYLQDEARALWRRHRAICAPCAASEEKPPCFDQGAP